jgi:hypothetical protein
MNNSNYSNQHMLFENEFGMVAHVPSGVPVQSFRSSGWAVFHPHKI